MASNPPVVRQIAWIALIPQLIVIGILIAIFYFANTQDPFLYGAFTYLILSILLKYLFAKAHRQGMYLVKQKKFQESIPFFERSYDFFSKYSWIDKYRFITLLSASKMCYREMALNNIAFCYSQIGDGQKAIKYYIRTLNEYPDNMLAKTALTFINTINNTQQQL